MDFSKLSPKPKVSNPTKASIRTVYANNTWYAKVSGKLIPIAIESLDITNCLTLYRIGDENEWSSRTISSPLTGDIAKISLYWSRFKPGLRIKGTIKKGEFYAS